MFFWYTHTLTWSALEMVARVAARRREELKKRMVSCWFLVGLSMVRMCIYKYERVSDMFIFRVAVAVLCLRGTSGLLVEDAPASSTFFSKGSKFVRSFVHMEAARGGVPVVTRLKGSNVVTSRRGSTLPKDLRRGGRDGGGGIMMCVMSE